MFDPLVGVALALISHVRHTWSTCTTLAASQQNYQNRVPIIAILPNFLANIDHGILLRIKHLAVLESG